MMIIKLRKKAAFTSLLETALTDGKPGLEDLLITPVQRLPRCHRRP